MATAGFVNWFIEDLGEANAQAKPYVKATLKENPKVRWLPPPVGSMKVNVDAAVAKSVARGDVAAVCRSDGGAFLGASAMVFEGLSHPGTLEAVACWEL
jgi:hypothetical protein